MAEPQRLSAEDRNNLVAFLDHELPDLEARSIARKLENSSTAKREVSALERTWELLDYLPRPRPSDESITRTVTLATQLDALGDRAFSATADSLRRTLILLAAAAGLFVTAGAGYAAMRWLWPDDTARLARRLSIAEHLDEYQSVGSFEFLQLLDHSPTAFSNPDP